jgi:Flp pilus assembly protein TadG
MSENVPRSKRINWSDDRGFAGGTEALPFGMLVFVVGILLVLNLWSVIATKMAVNAAARQAAHAVAEYAPAPGENIATGVNAEAATVARSTVETYTGKPAPEVTAATEGTITWARCAEFTVVVDYSAPLVRLPLVGQFGTSWPISARASSIVDPYRADVGAGGRC